MNSVTTCPACRSGDIETVYCLASVPVHSVLLHPTREEALQYPRGEIELVFCRGCGFLYNAAFKPDVHEYSAKYEATQGYSSTFNAFHQRLAETLIRRYDLRGKKIIEIGCGQGEFLTLLCEMGDNQGLGYDPAYVPERSKASPSARVQFVQDFYTPVTSSASADFFCCKMTLEHIQDTGEFITMLRSSLGEQNRATVFFQVPNVRYVLKEAAFWDIYYEHCSYFSTGSMARLFRRAGFDVIDLWTDYDEQYLMVAAQAQTWPPAPLHPAEHDLHNLAREVAAFKERSQHRIAAWRERLEQAAAGGERVVLWGGGSKAVAFLSTLGVSRERLPYVVDINPHKHGTFLAGTGQEVIGPKQLASYNPHLVIVMNPVYCAEIEQTLAGLGLAPELLSVESYG